MRSELLQFGFCLFALVLGGALEEFLPNVIGVGIPVLLAISMVTALECPVWAAVFFAFSAGLFEDALSALPAMTSPCFFLVVALLARRVRFARTVLVGAYPAYQIWLVLIVPGLTGTLVLRCLLAFAIAAIVAFALLPPLTWMERRAVVDAA